MSSTPSTNELVALGAPIVLRDDWQVEIEVPIPPVGLAPALKKLIRIAAQHDVAVPLAHRSGPRSLAAPT